MEFTPKELARELRKCAQQIIDDRPTELVRIINDAWALEKRRIRAQSVDFEGNSFASYSDLYAPVRREEGYQTDRVDFTKTGRMLNSVKPTLESNGRESAVVVLAPDNDLDNDKLLGQIKNRGDVLVQLSKESQEFAIKAGEARIFKLLKKKIG